MSGPVATAIGCEAIVVILIFVIAAILADAGTIANVISTWVGE